MSQSTYGRWYIQASYGHTVTVDLETWPDRMTWIESRATEVLAEIAASTAAKAGDRKEVAPTYTGKHALKSERVTVSASAPATVTHSGQRPSIRPYTVPAGWVSPADLQSRCMAAARLTLTGRQWTAEDMAECASAILLGTLERQTETVRHGRPADVLRFIDRNMHRETGHVSPKAASMARLTHLAANWRRGEDRQRQRDAEDAANRATLAGNVVATLDDGVTAGPMAAAKTAIDALQNLGLDAKAARRVWPLAYTAARAAGIPGDRETRSDMDGATLAAELGMTHAAYRQALSRATGYVPSVKPWRNPVTDTVHPNVYSYTEHLDAVCAACEAIATDPRSITTDATDGPDWPARSAKAYKGAPVTVSRDASVKRDGRRTYAPAEWTASLAPNTRRRLATAAEMKRARAASRTAEETATLRMANGLPATVR